MAFPWQARLVCKGYDQVTQGEQDFSKVHCIMGSMFGSMNNIPITKRSMRAICAQIAKDQMDDDIQKTLNIFRQMMRRRSEH